MKRCTDYVIVTGSDLDDLQRKMQDFLSRDGIHSWCPIGPPVFQQDKSGNWHQAVAGFLKDDE